MRSEKDDVERYNLGKSESSPQLILRTVECVDNIGGNTVIDVGRIQTLDGHLVRT